jgi:hypothetical protein
MSSRPLRQSINEAVFEPFREREGEHAAVGREHQPGELQCTTALQREQAVLADEAQVGAQHQKEIGGG